MPRRAARPVLFDLLAEAGDPEPEPLTVVEPEPERPAPPVAPPAKVRGAPLSFYDEVLAMVDGPPVDGYAILFPASASKVDGELPAKGARSGRVRRGKTS